MLTLTREERQVILFLISTALLGLGISFLVKINSPVARVLQADDRIARINLNAVSPEELAKVPGITPKLAENIAVHRNTKGKFKDIAELKEIKGIGDYRYEKLKDLFFVE